MTFSLVLALISQLPEISRCFNNQQIYRTTKFTLLYNIAIVWPIMHTCSDFSLRSRLIYVYMVGLCRFSLLCIMNEQLQYQLVARRKP